MFGAKPIPFGFPANTNVGTATPFGGGNNSFGAKPAGTTAFGTPNTGVFGAQPTAAPAGGLFGQTSTSTGGLFGSQPATGTFGQSQSGGFTFGSTPAAGTTSGGGLFGQQPQQNTGSGLFSTPATANAFGSKTPGFGGFGATSTPGTGTSLFGQQPSNTSLFGQTAGSSGFGQQQQPNSQVGTNLKFSAPVSQDTMVKNGVSTHISTRHQCITAMKEYQNKSLEELRVEDYLAGRKGKQQAAFFGATPASSSGGFSFNKPQATGFAASAAPFGTTPATQSSLFSQPQNPTATASPFGQNKSLFGAAAGTATSTTGFGAGFGNTGTSLFGSNQPKPGGFGASAVTSTQPSLFGNTSFGAQTSGSFGATGGFGAPATGGGLFGAKPKPLFGAAATSAPTGFGVAQSSNLFAKPANNTGTGLFGNTTTSTFGASTGFGGFGNATFGNTGNSLFGSKPLGFGATSTPSLALNSNTFNNTLSKPAFGGFGNTTAPAFPGLSANTQLNLGNTTLSTAPSAVANSANQLQIQQQLLNLVNSPYGDSPLFMNLKQSEVKREELLKPTNPAAQKAALSNQFKVSPRPTARVKPKSLHSVLNGSKSQMFEGLEDEGFSFGNETFQPKKSIKKLVIKKGGSDSSSPGSRSSSVMGEPTQQLSVLETDGPDISNTSLNMPAEPVVQIPQITTPVQKPSNQSMDDTMAMLNVPKVPNRITSRSPDETDLDMSQTEDSMERRPTTPPPPHAADITLTRPGYYTIPSMEELGDMVDEQGECFVDGFTIGRERYGSIFFPGVFSVAGLNLDEIVHIRRKEVVVYPDDDNKPSVGDGLNRKAEITLDCVWPIDKSDRTPIKSPERLAAMNYQEKIEEITHRIGGRFIDYRPETGSWVFEVKHFTKYGMDESDEEDLSDLAQKQQKPGQQKPGLSKQLPPHVGHGQSYIPQQPTNGAAPPPKFSLDISQPAMDDRPVPMGDDDDVPDLSHNDIPEEYIDDMGDEDLDDQDEGPASHRLAASMGVSAHSMQMMKASFFGDEEQHNGGDRDKAIEKRHETTDKHGPSLFSSAYKSKCMSPVKLSQMPQTTDFREQQGDEDLDDQDEGPASHRLAASMGVSAHSMQMMKASFFGDEEQHNGGDRDKAIEKRHETTDKHGPSLFSSAYKSKCMSPVKLSQMPQTTDFREQQGMFPPRIHTPEPIRPAKKNFQYPPVAEHMTLASGMKREDFPQKIVGSRVQREIPEYSKSEMYGKQNLIKDAALFMGRSFRVGWGPNWTLAHCGTPITKEITEEKDVVGFSLLSGGRTRPAVDSTYEWKVTMEKVDVAGYFRQEDTTVVHNHEELLMIQLDHSEKTRSDSCPHFVPSPGVDALHQYADRAKLDKQDTEGHPDYDSLSHMTTVFDLCVSLWGRLPAFPDLDDIEDCYDYHHDRREALSQWLMDTSKEVIKKEISDAKYKNKNHLPAVLAHLSGNQISEACSLAQSSSDHRLALTLAQAAGSHIPRQLVESMLNEWIELEAQKRVGYLDPVRQKIYSLMAGRLVWPTPESTVNSCEYMDWKRALALHLWYLCPPSCPIQQALEEYDNGFHGATTYGRYCNPPLPPYLEQSSDLSTMGTDEDLEIQDTCYHLLKLYSQRSHNLQPLLNPSSSTSSHLDYRLSWHLHQSLDALGYRHLSSYHRNSIHMSFASQLESLGLWEWAVFAVLHIEQQTYRESAVRELLLRHVSLSKDHFYLEKEQFLREKLDVPAEWIHFAKAMRARFESRPHEEAWHLLKSGHWNDSHRVVLNHIASDAIISENHDYLRKFLAELSPPTRCNKIVDWSRGGHVFMDYINLCQELENLKKDLQKDEQRSNVHLEGLHSDVMSLCSRVGSLVCTNSKDRLCQSEMSKKCAYLLRTLLTLQGQDGDHLPSRLLAPHISRLPMPEDYCLQELRELVRSHIIETTVT
ncbi:nuclear pore complex protein Nup98-Nup96-like [Pecten maximus]|uniref:nuclear pore complex protein Nup98-Nup96-like n=1 Tax=Pecten maximus TaxID=6579 RepID=UPI0014584FC6|nr:nuclear pore complex protein Nup98-Nup96-like [Pecten maximus]